MYHLTKKIGDNFAKRDAIFLKLIKNNYSNSIISQNIDEIRQLISPKTTQNINLGATIRNMLAAVSVLGYKHNLHIVCEVFGNGCFKLNLNQFETDLIKLLIISAKGSLQNKVHVKILIKCSGLLVNIKYKTNALPNNYDRANLTYVIKLKGAKNGITVDFNDYLIDRLSTVNLAFIDLLNQ